MSFHFERRDFERKHCDVLLCYTYQQSFWLLRDLAIMLLRAATDRSTLMRAASERSVASADVTVGRLEKQLEAWFARRGSRDVVSLVQAFGDQATWKTSPRANVLALIADLLSFTVSPIHFLE